MYNYADNPENLIYVENPKDYRNKIKHLLELKNRKAAQLQDINLIKLAYDLYTKMIKH